MIDAFVWSELVIDIDGDLIGFAHNLSGELLFQLL